MVIIDIIGYLGALALGACAIPQAIQSYRTRSSQGLSLVFLLLWTLGEIALGTYTAATLPLRDGAPLLINYGINLLCLGIILRFWKPGGGRQ